MRTLAEKVDYSPAALYKYFADKEEIIEALRQEAWEMMANHEPNFPPGMSMADMFVQSGRNYVDFATRYPEFYLLAMSIRGTGPKSLEEFNTDPNFLHLLEFIEAAVAAGEFQVPEGYAPYHLALLSWFVVHGVSLLKLTMMSNCQEEFEAVSIEVMEMIKATFGKK
jgi:AcrR family transcriptional regulator